MNLFEHISGIQRAYPAIEFVESGAIRWVYTVEYHMIHHERWNLGVLANGRYPGHYFLDGIYYVMIH